MDYALISVKIYLDLWTSSRIVFYSFVGLVDSTKQAIYTLAFATDYHNLRLSLVWIPSSSPTSLK